MQKYKAADSGKEFYLPASIRTLLNQADRLDEGAFIALTNVSLTNVPEPKDTPFGGTTPSWYEISDPSGAMVAYWPAMLWFTDASGLTDEMRRSGRFFVPVLELQNSKIFGIQIRRIIRRPEPKAPTKPWRIRDWFLSWRHARVHS